MYAVWPLLNTECKVQYKVQNNIFVHKFYLRIQNETSRLITIQKNSESRNGVVRTHSSSFFRVDLLPVNTKEMIKNVFLPNIHGCRHPKNGDAYCILHTPFLISELFWFVSTLDTSNIGIYEIWKTVSIVKDSS